MWSAAEHLSTGYVKVTDVGVSALAAGCGQLQSIVLQGCSLVTDIGVSALGAGCGQLLSIFIKDCDKVTDAFILSLGHIHFRRVEW